MPGSRTRFLGSPDLPAPKDDYYRGRVSGVPGAVLTANRVTSGLLHSLTLWLVVDPLGPEGPPQSETRMEERPRGQEIPP